MRKLAVLVLACLLLVGCSQGGLITREVATATDRAPLRLTMIGASSFYGAAATGATSPKPVNSVVGLLRAKAEAAYGKAGSGLVIPTAATRENSAYDPRFAFTGTVGDAEAGFFGASAWALAEDATVTFADTARSFRVWTQDGALVAVDDKAPTAVGPGRETVAAGALGPHTLRIHGPAVLLGVEAVTGTGRLVVDSVAENGRSAEQFQQPASLAMLDALKPNVVVISLGTNDVMSGESVDAYVGYLTTIVEHVTASGGRAVLHIQPVPSPDLQPAGGPTWDDHRAAVLALGAKLHCQVIDQSRLWGGSYTAGEAAGKYADAIHPSDSGARDIADGIWKVLNG